MRRSYFLKKGLPYSLGGLSLSLTVGLSSNITACQKGSASTQNQSIRDSTTKPVNGKSVNGSTPQDATANNASANTTTTSAEEGVWRVAIAQDLRPFAMTKGKRLVGFDVELIKAVGKACGATLRLESHPFDALIPLIQANRIDVAIGAVPITPERSKIVDFSQPYFRSGVAIAALPQNEQLKTLASLENRPIAVQLGTAGARLATEIPGSSLLTFEKATDVVKAIQKKDAEAALIAMPTLLDTLKNKRGFSIKKVGDLIEPHDFGIMVRRALNNNESNNESAPSVIEAINTALTTLVEDKTYAKIHKRWLGAEPT